ncbi:MAG: hypothetical protein EZS28_039533 [Streblomastix strix]|uniref:Uncharacterized protein n=1 Tax=Streblomastix strix TaxID=222440 RepID=A0A5J4U473_9EUKA|nr:MAG: hypothetical protein EZS28_039533 [Streblomastix strix]
MLITNQARAAIFKRNLKLLRQFQNLRLYPKEEGKSRICQIRNKKTLTMGMNGSRAPDRTGTLQPNEINVEISHRNRKEERTDEDGNSGDGGKNWRNDIQRKGEWNGGNTKRFIQALKQIWKEDFIIAGFYLRFKDQNSYQRLEENKMAILFRGTKEEKEAYQEMLKEELKEGMVIPIQQNQVKW